MANSIVLPDIGVLIERGLMDASEMRPIHDVVEQFMESIE